ncbi:MAG: hypothetical protein NTW28_02225 [Candidatus Solibacter sp.]|nr:hypothetical protein [Candidatus Solibacter sp.]
MGSSNHAGSAGSMALARPIAVGQDLVTLGDFAQVVSIRGGRPRTARPAFAEADSELEDLEAFRIILRLLEPVSYLRLVQQVVDAAVGIDRGRGTRRAAHQPVDGLADDLTREIPECDVDTADQPDVGYERVLRGGHEVEQVLNRQRVLSHPDALLHLLDARTRHLSSAARLSVAHYAGVGLNLDQTAVADVV